MLLRERYRHDHFGRRRATQSPKDPLGCFERAAISAWHRLISSRRNSGCRASMLPTCARRWSICRGTRPSPGCELAPTAERARLPNRGRNRRGDDRPDARNGRQALAHRIALVERHHAFEARPPPPRPARFAPPTLAALAAPGQSRQAARSFIADDRQSACQHCVSPAVRSLQTRRGARAMHSPVPDACAPASRGRDVEAERCCSAVLTGTKRIVGRTTASQIACASAASFLLRLT